MFTLLPKRLKNARMDMLLVSDMSQEQRETQHRVDVARENIERQRRNEEALDLMIKRTETTGTPHR